MAERVWTAAELEELTASEQDRIFESTIVRDLNQVPTEYLERVRARLAPRIQIGPTITEG